VVLVTAINCHGGTRIEPLRQAANFSSILAQLVTAAVRLKGGARVVVFGLVLCVRDVQYRSSYDPHVMRTGGSGYYGCRNRCGQSHRHQLPSGPPYRMARFHDDHSRVR
jgi:hypothetical protein